MECRSDLNKGGSFLEAVISDPRLRLSRHFSFSQSEIVTASDKLCFGKASRTFSCSTSNFFPRSCNMPALSRGIRSFASRGPRVESICSRCLFSTTSTVQSGHNRWSKIKHDKGKADANKNAQRSILSHEIALASKSKKSGSFLGGGMTADFQLQCTAEIQMRIRV